MPVYDNLFLYVSISISLSLDNLTLSLYRVLYSPCFDSTPILHRFPFFLSKCISIASHQRRMPLTTLHPSQGCHNRNPWHWQ